MLPTAKEAGARLIVNKVLRSQNVTSTAFYCSGKSLKPADIKGRELDFMSQWEE